MKNRILLINPWITDVAAYDLWAWPLGLLYWASRLREWGFRIALVDCMDRHHPALLGQGALSSKPWGIGKYLSADFEEQPYPARAARRVFRRYGMPVDVFEAELAKAEEPDAILVTSRMTYWYHGVQDAIGRCRRRWPSVPIILGGGYATLCANHARTHSGADLVLEGGALDTLPPVLQKLEPALSDAIRPPCEHPDRWPRPALDLCGSRDALPILTSIGCPFRCTYCASQRLFPQYLRRSPEAVFEEIADYHGRWGTMDFAFYDDALLVDSDCFFAPFLDRVIRSGLAIRFHTPNGMHAEKIDEALAERMRQAGMETIRLSLESVSPDRLAQWNRPREGARALAAAVRHLRKAGFSRGQVGVYIMAGMPGQEIEEVIRAIRLVQDAGATPKINDYSPIPGTEEWQRALEISGSEIETEPLWQNNNLYAARPESRFKPEDFAMLRGLARRGAEGA